MRVLVIIGRLRLERFPVREGLKCSLKPERKYLNFNYSWLIPNYKYSSIYSVPDYIYSNNDKYPITIRTDADFNTSSSSTNLSYTN